jgi:peroxiredoxin Q/BCP
MPYARNVVLKKNGTPDKRIKYYGAARSSGSSAPTISARSTPTASMKRKAEETLSEAKATKAAKESIEPSQSAFTSTAASKLLEKGQSLPSLTLKDESGKDVKISDLKKTVLFTYPKANTPGCTTQACLFRDEYAAFQKAGFEVYGLSSDSETSLKNWKEKKGFKYSLLSDPKRQLIKVLTGSKSSTIRSHFVIDGEGKLALSEVKVKPAEVCIEAMHIATFEMLIRSLSPPQSSSAALKFAQRL